MKEKFICTIEARMGSKRFPGKTLKKLYFGFSIIFFKTAPFISHTPNGIWIFFKVEQIVTSF